MHRDPVALAPHRNAPDRIESIVRGLAAHAGGQVVRRDVWLMVRPAEVGLAPHGWKLHVSARPGNYPGLIELVVPVLLERRVVFKVAATVDLLIRINSGNDSPAAVGKAVTIYPPADLMAPLGRELAELLDGFEGPRIASDRRISPTAPVYYRYGPFQGSWRADEFGTVQSEIRGPDGQLFSGLADLSYRQPDWVDDPFSHEPGARDTRSTGPNVKNQPVIAGKYRITAGIQRNVRGSVFRAERAETGQPVIVKLARAFVGEDHAEFDARLRLRNERRILSILSDVEGVPRFLDHLQLGADEVLVLTDEGPRNLVDQVTESGRYGSADLRTLATELARIVRNVHRAGVLIRDLSPKNVLVSPSGSRIVDFGIAGAEDIVPPGFTAGYSPPSQRRHSIPLPSDDCYALGMTLLFAATGLDPVVVDDTWTRTRALETLAAIGDPLGLAGLLDQERAVAALTRLADGGFAASAGLPGTPVVDVALAADITEFLLQRLIDRLRVQLADGSSDRLRIDAAVHRGVAGAGLELLHHRDIDGVPELIGRLADQASSTAVEVGLPAGLHVGTTGISVFLAAAARAGLTDRRLDEPGPPAGADLMLGSVGVGVGRLLLFQLTGDEAELAQAGACANQLSSQSETAFSLPPEASRTGVDAAAGLAHGRAGQVLLLARLAAVDPSYVSSALDRALALAAEVPRLIELAELPATRPLAASWCQGLAGVARALYESGVVLHRPELTDAALQAGQVSLGWVPRLATVGQCCGLAGIGSMLLAQGPARATAGLEPGVDEVSRQLLRRSAGPSDRPIFDVRFGTDDPSWGYGTTGLLAYFRSVRDGATSTDAFSAVPRRTPAARHNDSVSGGRTV